MKLVLKWRWMMRAMSPDSPGSAAGNRGVKRLISIEGVVGV